MKAHVRAEDLSIKNTFLWMTVFLFVSFFLLLLSCSAKDDLCSDYGLVQITGDSKLPLQVR